MDETSFLAVILPREGKDKLVQSFLLTDAKENERNKIKILLRSQCIYDTISITES
jgi:hypothetical protein